MNIRHVIAQEGDRALRPSFIRRHRVWLVGAIAGVAALTAFVTETTPRDTTPVDAHVVPVTLEKFDYFPQLYENQARQIEEPIATF